MSRETGAGETIARVLVIGVGNPDRGDDGVGRLIVRRLIGQVPPDVAIIERTGDALALIDDWAGREAVILVDAAVSGATHGDIRRIDLLADTLPPELSLASTHAFGIAEAAGLAGVLGLLPARIIAYAIEGANFSPGALVSPMVAAAVDEAVSRITAELRVLLRQQPNEPPMR